MNKSYSVREIALGIIVALLGVFLLFLGSGYGWVLVIAGAVLFLAGVFMKKLLKWEMKKETGANQIAEDDKGGFIEVYEEN